MCGKPILEGVEVCQDYLFNNLLPLAGDHGLEHNRKGGSSGKIKLDSQPTICLLKRPGKFPVRRRAMILIALNTPKVTGLLGLYMKAGEAGRIVASWIYPTPQYGGSLSLSSGAALEVLNKSKVLQRLPACRVIAAMICHDYNNNQANQIGTVIREAARKLLDEWQHCVFMSQIGGARATNHHKRRHNRNRRPLIHMATHAFHTLVAHPVGAHRDVFANNGTDCIENKLILVSSDWSPRKGNHLVSRGRGGLPSFFTFAILDWDGPSVRRRRRYEALGGREDRITHRNPDTFGELITTHLTELQQMWWNSMNENQQEAYVEGLAIPGMVPPPLGNVEVPAPGGPEGFNNWLHGIQQAD
ncbi:unnamed protein product [Cylindrotheca closterium]|nr:unnamed protein product [Cylindrotheca closterium]